MDGKKEMKRALEKAHLYGLLAEYYKYHDPELVMHYYQKHFKYTRKVAIMAWNSAGKQRGKGKTTSSPRSALSSGTPSRLRVIHASPDAPTMEVQVDGERIDGGLTFGQVSHDQLISSGSHQVELYGVEGQGEPIAAQAVSLEPGKGYTLLVVNQLKDLDLQLICQSPEDCERMSKNQSGSSLPQMSWQEF